MPNLTEAGRSFMRTLRQAGVLVLVFLIGIGLFKAHEATALMIKPSISLGAPRHPVIIHILQHNPHPQLCADWLCPEFGCRIGNPPLAKKRLSPGYFEAADILCGQRPPGADVIHAPSGQTQFGAKNIGLCVSHVHYFELDKHGGNLVGNVRCHPNAEPWAASGDELPIPKLNAFAGEFGLFGRSGIERISEIPNGNSGERRNGRSVVIRGFNDLPEND